MSSMRISVSAAGIAIATRIAAGITVQITSIVALCVNLAATAPCDFRNLTIAAIMAA
ncbi:hypothetical protein D3C83_172280 [compost metagenome]